MEARKSAGAAAQCRCTAPKPPSRVAKPVPLLGGVRGGFVGAGSGEALIRFPARIGTVNLPGNSKAPQGRRTPKPGGSSGGLGQRASVLECGGPPPLWNGARRGTRMIHGGAQKRRRCCAVPVHCSKTSIQSC